MLWLFALCVSVRCEVVNVFGFDAGNATGSKELCTLQGMIFPNVTMTPALPSMPPCFGLPHYAFSLFASEIYSINLVNGQAFIVLWYFDSHNMSVSSVRAPMMDTSSFELMAQLAPLPDSIAKGAISFVTSGPNNFTNHVPFVATVDAATGKVMGPNITLSTSIWPKEEMLDGMSAIDIDTHMFYLLAIGNLDPAVIVSVDLASRRQVSAAYVNETGITNIVFDYSTRSLLVLLGSGWLAKIDPHTGGVSRIRTFPVTGDSSHWYADHTWGDTFLCGRYRGGLGNGACVSYHAKTNELHVSRGLSEKDIDNYTYFLTANVD